MFNSFQNVCIKSLNDQRPSTSRHCKKNLSPERKSWRKLLSKVNRFKKDDLAKRLLKHDVNDNHALRKVSPKKGSPSKKYSKRLINNNRKKHLRNLRRKMLHDISSTLEEGEIRSYVDRSLATTSNDVIKIIENNEDDDCIVVEPILDEITIDDNANNDFPSTSDVSTSYQSIIKSFTECDSSTPYQKRKSPTSHATVANENEGGKPTANCILPFFVDVGGGGTESINSTDDFTDYTKLSTLKEKSGIETINEPSKPIAGCCEVIDLDDTSVDSTDETIKCKSDDLDEDSVIFISETNKNDFIPIANDDLPPHKILKVSEPKPPETPVCKLATNSLFTMSEKKKLNKYNENAYNPSASEVLTSRKRMIIIDGSNVAFKHGLDQEFSVKGLKVAIEYFEKMGHEVKAVIPQFRMNKSKSTNCEMLEKLHKAGKIVQTPCKNLPGYTSISYDDRFILQLAFETDAVIVSNDNYRDLLRENPAFKKIIENRVIGYTWCNDIFILPKDPYGKWGPSLDTILNRS